MKSANAGRAQSVILKSRCVDGEMCTCLFMMNRILLTLTFLVCLNLGCRVTDPPGNPPVESGPLPPDGIVSHVYPAGFDRDVWIDWIAPDGSGRRTLFKDEWRITGSPNGARFPLKHGAPIANTSVGDSLFVYDMNTRQRTFIHAYPWAASCGMVLSLNGSMVAYYADFEWDEDVSNLRIARVDGTGSRILVANAWIAADPAFSPDGGKIAYSEYQSGLNQLHVVDLSNGLNVVIADSVIQYGRSPISWSPDGTRIVCSRRNRDDDFAAWVINVDGSGMQQLSPLSTTDLDPQWSPDGSQIVCTSGPLNFHRNIVLMKSDGTERRQLTRTTDMGNDQAQWSPDGTKILYRSSTSYSDRFMFLYIIDVQTGTVRELVAAGAIGDTYWDESKR